MSFDIIGVGKIVKASVTAANEQILKQIDNMQRDIDRNLDVALKKQAFYKENYTKIINEVFDYWTDLISVTTLKENSNLSDNEQKKQNEKFNKLTNIVKLHEMSVKTLKFAALKLHWL